MIMDTYFEEKTIVARSIALSGVGIGIIFMPVIVQTLYIHLGWKGMLLVLAGISFQLVLCGATMRPMLREKLKYSERDLLKIFEPALLHCSVFTCMCICNIIWSFGISIIYTFLPEFAISTGSTIDDGIILIGITGLSSFTSRLLFVVFSQSAQLDNASIILCTVGLTAILTGVFPELFEHMAGQIGYAIILGLHTGFWTIFMGHVSTELIGEPYMAYGKGFVYLSVATGLLAGPPVAGWILDQKEDFEIIFYLAGKCKCIKRGRL